MGINMESIKSKFGNMEVKNAFDLSQRFVICIEIKSLTHLCFKFFQSLITVTCYLTWLSLRRTDLRELSLGFWLPVRGIAFQVINPSCCGKAMYHIASGAVELEYESHDFSSPGQGHENSCYNEKKYLNLSTATVCKL